MRILWLSIIIALNVFTVRAEHSIARTFSIVSDVVIPNVDFQDCTLEDVLQFIYQRQREIDYVDLGEAPRVKFKGNSARLHEAITLNAQNITTLELIGKVADLADLKVEFAKGDIYFVASE